MLLNIYSLCLSSLNNHRHPSRLGIFLAVAVPGYTFPPRRLSPEERRQWSSEYAHRSIHQPPPLDGSHPGVIYNISVVLKLHHSIVGLSQNI